MLGGLQRAKVIERAVLQRVQARIGQVALGVKEFFVIKNKGSFVLPPLGNLLAQQQFGAP